MPTKRETALEAALREYVKVDESTKAEMSRTARIAMATAALDVPSDEHQIGNVGEHTPGDWHVSHRSGQDGNGGYSYFQVKAGDRVLFETCNQVATDRDAANARLAATSPRMLAALEAAAPVIARAQPATFGLLQQVSSAIKAAKDPDA